MPAKSQSQLGDRKPPKLNIEGVRKGNEVADQGVQIAGFVTDADEAAKLLRIKTKPLDTFWLALAQREVVLLISGLPKTIKNKLAKENPLTVSEVARMTLALVEDLRGGTSQKQLALLLVAKHLMDCLEEGIKAMAEPLTKKSNPMAQSKHNVLYQFKITLLESIPQTWRRIQVKDSTLDKFHERIQTAMGWTNSHLHQFKIDDECYGDPELLDDFECIDSTVTKISEIVPRDGRRFRFLYEYDFGDGWEHEVWFEACLCAEKGGRYPVCVEGGRDCPPEDVDGVWGYADFLEAIGDLKHERHDEFVEWAGEFDPENFNAAKTTRAMRRGLPDWRQM